MPKQSWTRPRGMKLPHPLRPYQWEGVQFLLERDSALLADEMGLGKSVQVAVALSILFRESKITRALIVVPASLKLNWEVELKRWAPRVSVRRMQGAASDRQATYILPVNVIISSYEEIRTDIHKIASDIQFDVVILDEAQRIKNAGVRTALACRLLNRGRSWALTGTPLENNIDDLISVFRFVKDGILHGALTRIEIHTRMRRYFLRRRKQDVLKEIPPIIDQDIPLELEGKQREAYLRAWEGRLSDMGSTSHRPSEVDLLALITKLKQLCNYDLDSGQSAKLDTLQTIIDEQVGEEDKVIVFSQYVETLRWLSQRLSKIPNDFFYGGLSQTAREQVLDRFRREPGPRILFMSLKAGGIGLNIQEASVVVLFDRWWNPATEMQAVTRAHRFGRTRPLHVIRFTVQNTIEEKIAAILDRKQQLFENYIDEAENATVETFGRQLLETILEMQPS